MNTADHKRLDMEIITGGAKLYINTSLGQVDLREFVKLAIKRSGKTPGYYEYKEGMDHSTSWLWLTGKSESLRSALAWLDALGYDLVIVKREDA